MLNGRSTAKQPALTVTVLAWRELFLSPECCIPVLLPLRAWNIPTIARDPCMLTTRYILSNISVAVNKHVGARLFCPPVSRKPVDDIMSACTISDSFGYSMDP